jgi:hypothetical protein
MGACVRHFDDRFLVAADVGAHVVVRILLMRHSVSRRLFGVEIRQASSQDVADLKASIAAEQQAIVSQLGRMQASLNTAQGDAVAWRSSQHHLQTQMLEVLRRLDEHAMRVHPSAAVSAAVLQATETDWMQLHDVVNQMLYSIMQRQTLAPVAAAMSASNPPAASTSSVMFPALRNALAECTASKDDTDALRRAFTHIVDVLTSSPAFASTVSAASSLSAASAVLKSARYACDQ